MPDERLKRTRESLPEGYQFGDASVRAVSDRYLSENFRSGKFPFTPQGVADAVDDAIGRAVYERVGRSEEWNIREGGMHS